MYNLDFSICAVFVLILLIFFIIYKKAYKGISGGIYLIIVVLLFFNAIADIWNGYTTAYSYGIERWELYLSSYLYLIPHNFLPFLYVAYIISLAGAGERFVKNKKKGILLLLPLLINVVIFSLAPVLDWVFYYDRDKAYFRGPAMPVLFLTAAVYLVLVPVLVCSYRALIPRAQRYAIYTFAPMVTLAVVLQFLFPNELLEIFGETLCMTAIFFTLQDPAKRYDAVTGLGNEELFLHQTKCSFYIDRKFTMLSVNLMNYEQLENMLGRLRMEEVVKGIAAYLVSLPVREDAVFCTGRGSFQVLIEKELSKAEMLAQQINQKFHTVWNFNGISATLQCFVSVTKCPKEIYQEEKLLEFAKYAWKHLHYTGNVQYTGKILSSNEYFLEEDMEEMIEWALQNHKFQVYYQPIYNQEEHRYKSAEALVRMFNNGGRMIVPDRFISVAEENGSIIRIGMLVLEEVCRLLASGKAQKLGIEYIEVNLSVVQCMQKDFDKAVLEMLGKYQIPPHMLNLEITETAAAASQIMLEENVRSMYGKGIMFSLDDYGTGYANIDYVTSLPFSILKVDRSLVCTRQQNERKWIAMCHTIRMARELGIKVVAEGVDSLEKQDMLEQLGCEYLQGYYFSTPVPEKEFLQFLAIHHEMGGTEYERDTEWNA